MNRPNRNLRNTNNLTGLAVNGTWLNAVLNATSLIATVAVLTIAYRNYGVNKRTLEISERNLENTEQNANNTTDMIEQLKIINQHLERIL